MDDTPAIIIVARIMQGWKLTQRTAGWAAAGVAAQADTVKAVPLRAGATNLHPFVEFRFWQHVNFVQNNRAGEFSFWFAPDNSRRF